MFKNFPIFNDVADIISWFRNLWLFCNKLSACSANHWLSGQSNILPGLTFICMFNNNDNPPTGRGHTHMFPHLAYTRLLKLILRPLAIEWNL